MSFILNGISICNVVRTGKKLGCCGRRFEQIFISFKTVKNRIVNENRQEFRRRRSKTRAVQEKEGVRGSLAQAQLQGA